VAPLPNLRIWSSEQGTPNRLKKLRFVEQPKAREFEKPIPEKEEEEEEVTADDDNRLVEPKKTTLIPQILLPMRQRFFFFFFSLQNHQITPLTHSIETGRRKQDNPNLQI
jgi:hypothetical protein